MVYNIKYSKTSKRSPYKNKEAFRKAILDKLDNITHLLERINRNI